MSELGVWIHQFNQLPDPSPQALADMLLPRGITHVYIKTHDGMYWMNQIYTHEMAPGPGNWASLLEQFEAVGLDLVPWVNPRGAHPADEARQHASAGVPAQGVIVDFEYHYAGFWESGLGEWGIYTQALVNAMGGNWTAIAPDPRQINRDYGAANLSAYHAILPQTYWTDFQREWQVVLAQAAEVCSGLAPMEPILPSNAFPWDIQAAQEWAASQGLGGLSLWKLPATQAVLDAFAQDAVPVPEPEPEPQPPDCQAYIDKIDAALATLQAELNRRSATGRTVTIRRSVVQSAVDTLNS
jgi:hypothetical protein